MLRTGRGNVDLVSGEKKHPTVLRRSKSGNRSLRPLGSRPHLLLTLPPPSEGTAWISSGSMDVLACIASSGGGVGG
jgi:hypothetical protein